MFTLSRYIAPVRSSLDTGANRDPNSSVAGITTLNQDKPR